MDLKFLKTVFRLNVVHALILFLGFIATLYYDYIDQIEWLNIYSGFTGRIFWALFIAVISVVGFAVTLYVLITADKKTSSGQKLGLVLSIIGFTSPLILFMFPIIPATFSLTAAIFNGNAISKINSTVRRSK